MSSFQFRSGSNASVTSLGTRDNSSSSRSTAAVQADARGIPDSTEDTEEGTRKNRTKVSGMTRAHPWHDNESELVIALRASGLSYLEITVAGFEHWSYRGVRPKCLSILETPMWKGRLRQIEEMDDFERLEVVVAAQVAMACFRLQRTRGQQILKAQGRVRRPPEEDGDTADDNIVDDTTLDNTANDEDDDPEINETPPQLPESKHEYEPSGKSVGKFKKKMGPALDEQTKTTKEKKANRIGNGRWGGGASQSYAAANDTVVNNDAPPAEIRGTPDPEVADSARFAGTQPLDLDDDSDDDLPLTKPLRPAFKKMKIAAEHSGDEAQ